MRLLITISLFFLTTLLQAQDGFVIIDSISIEGNKKTKDRIILRELEFKVGDTIAVTQLAGKLERSEQFVRNTSLFNQVTINFKNWKGSTNQVHVHITVDEAWYLYPVPLFELADRNFNVWWVEQNRSLQRVNYGLEFAHLNFTGQKDKLKVNFKSGYKNKYSLKYSLPFINKGQTIGLQWDVNFSRRREINYATVDNKQAFYQDGVNFVLQEFDAGMVATYRPGLRLYHDVDITFRQVRVGDTIAQVLNPEFLLRGRKLQRFFSISYYFSYDFRDIRPYPLNGNYFAFTIEKDGLGIYKDRNGLALTARYDQFISFTPVTSVGLSVKGKLSLIRQRQPYNDNRALGFGDDFLRGYEYYIVDGLDMAYLKANIRFQLLKKELNFGKWVFIPQFRRMPIKLYLSLNNNIGYANDPFDKENNFLNNRLLWGGGLGLDFVLYYDKVFRIEYSFNHLLENGVFLHLNLNI
jgi:outer membrane protein assembly factor BamA